MKASTGNLIARLFLCMTSHPLFLAPTLAREDFQPSISKGGRSVPTFDEAIEISAK